MKYNGPNLKNSDSYAIFHKKLWTFIRPIGSIHGIYDPFKVLD